jgi:RNA ligase
MPLTDKYTYLFEILFPENRIVVDYGDRDDLVALGMVAKGTGRIWGTEFVENAGWQGPVAEVFNETSLSDALARKPREGAEGVVVFFYASNEMLKIKQEDYVALHRIIFGLNERAVWQRMMDGEEADDINKGLPEEFHPWVNKVAARIHAEAMSIVDSACDEMAVIMHRVGPLEDPCQSTDIRRARKKFFASMAMKSDNPGLMFSLYDEKSIHEAVYKMIRPEAISYTKEAA